MIELRELTAADQDDIWQLLYYAAHMPEAGEPLELAKTNEKLKIYAANFGKVGDLGIAALDQDKIIGGAWVRLLIQPRGFAYIDNQTPELAMSILPAYQGQGIGTQILQKLIERAKGEFAAICLSVRDNNSAAIALYQKLGFEKITDTSVANRVGGLSFNMIKRL